MSYHRVIRVMAYELCRGDVVLCYPDINQGGNPERLKVVDVTRDESDGDMYISIQNNTYSRYCDPGEHWLLDLSMTYLTGDPT